MPVTSQHETDKTQLLVPLYQFTVAFQKRKVSISGSQSRFQVQGIPSRSQVLDPLVLKITALQQPRFRLWAGFDRGFRQHSLPRMRWINFDVASIISQRNALAMFSTDAMRLDTSDPSQRRRGDRAEAF